jgi:hypothetical protein
MANPSSTLPLTDGSCLGNQHLLRRRWVQQAASLGFTLPLTSLADRLALAQQRRPSNRPKSLIVLWLQGGPSQLDTFDPHPGGLIGGDVQAVDSKIPGVRLAEAMSATAEQMHLACLVRSVVSKEGDHERATYNVKTGWRPDPTLVHPSIGAVLCHASASELEIPRHVAILSSQWPARGGYLGAKYDAFQTGDPRNPIPNLTSRVALDIRNQRLEMLQVVEREFQRGRLSQLDQQRTGHQAATARAATMMTSQQLDAFDIARESSSTVDRFGDSAFGRGCLAAVRLIETGVRCVEVELAGWDSHINNHQLQADNAKILDSGLAAMLAELEARDLLQDTVVLCGGEFGRTPLINPAGGRDHWPHGFSLLLAGAGFRRGHVHGATDPNPDPESLKNRSEGSFDPTLITQDPVTIADLHATILTALGVDSQESIVTPIGRPLKWSDGKAIASLLG